MEQALAESIAPRRFNLLLLGTFALVALVLAVIGVYGVVAYAVAERTQEIGIRLALGAERARVVRMIVTQGMSSVVVGIVAGAGRRDRGDAIDRRACCTASSAHDAPTFVVATVVLAASRSWRARRRRSKRRLSIRSSRCGQNRTASEICYILSDSGRSGGTGRRAGLKIPYRQRCVGSTPSSGTNAFLGKSADPVATHRASVDRIIDAAVVHHLGKPQTSPGLQKNSGSCIGMSGYDPRGVEPNRTRRATKVKLIPTIAIGRSNHRITEVQNVSIDDRKIRLAV